MESTFHANEQKLKYEYLEAIKDPAFKKLVARIKASDDLAAKYTSKLQRSVCELKNCSKCKGLYECKNSCEGSVIYPRVDGNMISFDYKECKYASLARMQEETSSVVFNEPLQIRNAAMKDIDLTDKNRLAAIKWIKDFYKNYPKNKHIKGLYLHGSFGSGKSYILAALLNELAKNGYSSVIMYYPQILKTLKESFNRNNDEDYDDILDTIMHADLLLIDDIGAENLTAWSRDDVLGTILQYRMDEILPTFFTSNLNIEELENHLAETKNNVDIVKAKRIIERIKFLSDDIELISKNRRG